MKGDNIRFASPSGRYRTPSGKLSPELPWLSRICLRYIHSKGKLQFSTAPQSEMWEERLRMPITSNFA